MEEDCSNFILRKRKSHLGKKHVLANILHIPSSNLNRKIITQNPKTGNYVWGNYRNKLVTNIIIFNEDHAPSASSSEFGFSFICPPIKLHMQSFLTLTTSNYRKESSWHCYNLHSPAQLLFLTSKFLQQATGIPNNNCLCSFQNSGLCFMGVRGALPQAKAWESGQEFSFP